MNEQTVAKIQIERQRQTDIWGKEQFLAMRPTQILAVLMEEVGEVAQAVLRLDYPAPLHPETLRRRINELEAEIVQVAAVAARWLDECFSGEAESGLLPGVSDVPAVVQRP